MERLAREKIWAQQRHASLKKELAAKWDHIDFSKLLPDLPPDVMTRKTTSELPTYISYCVIVCNINYVPLYIIISLTFSSCHKYKWRFRDGKGRQYGYQRRGRQQTQCSVQQYIVVVQFLTAHSAAHLRHYSPSGASRQHVSDDGEHHSHSSSDQKFVFITQCFATTNAHVCPSQRRSE